MRYVVQIPGITLHRENPPTSASGSRCEKNSKTMSAAPKRVVSAAQTMALVLLGGTKFSARCSSGVDSELMEEIT